MHRYNFRLFVAADFLQQFPSGSTLLSPLTIVHFYSFFRVWDCLCFFHIFLVAHLQTITNVIALANL